MQIEFEKRRCALICTGVMAPDITEKKKKEKIFWFLLDNISLNKLISLRLMWNMTVNNIQVEFEKGGYTSIRGGVMG